MSIVLFLRSPIDFVEKTYAQAIFDHDFTGSIDDFIDENMPVLDFNRQVELFNFVFGKQNVEIMRL